LWHCLCSVRLSAEAATSARISFLSDIRCREDGIETAIGL